MPDTHPLFAYSTVATAPSPATSGTSLVVAAGEGTKFAGFPFNATVWPVGAQPSTANAEIVRITGVSTDTLTITRAQEGSGARTIVVGDQIAVTITPKAFTDAEPGAIGIPKIVRRSANSAAKTNNTLADDDTLLWAVGANEVWHFEGFLLLTGANVTHDVKFGWSLPSGATMLWGGVIGSGVTLQPGYGATTTGASAVTAILTEASAYSTGSSAVTFGSHIGGVIRVSSTAGTVTFQWAQNTTDAGNLILLADSFFRLTRLA